MTTTLPEASARGARDVVVHPAGTWEALAEAHAARADALTAVWREARAAGRKHAIEDFLFTYYPTRAAQRRRGHPRPRGVLTLPAAGGSPAAHARTTWRG